MTETIVENFSCKSWLLINSKALEIFIQNFGFQFIKEQYSWQNSDFYEEKNFTTLDEYQSHQTDKILVSSPINEFQIVESKMFDFSYENYCKFLSKFYATYYMKIDIWIPIFKFSFYKQQKKNREYEYSIINDEENINEYGTELNFEKEDMHLIDSQYGYEYFFYPLSIMNYLGISNENIYHALNNKCTIYKVNKKG